MKETAAKTTTTEQHAKSSNPPMPSGIGLTLQFLDMSWRVAIPIVVFSLSGIRLDKHYQTKPLFTIVGLLFSLVVATLLVYRQIKVAYPDILGKGGTQ